MDEHEKAGYGQPPKATQFKPGRSGNPKGRPKGSRNFATELEKELAASVRVTENGKARQVSKRSVIAKQLVNKAAGGDLKATAQVMAESRQHEARTGEGTAITFDTPHDRLVMEGIFRRIRAMTLDGEIPVADVSTAASPATGTLPGAGHDHP